MLSVRQMQMYRQYLEVVAWCRFLSSDEDVDVGGGDFDVDVSMPMLGLSAMMIAPTQIQGMYVNLIYLPKKQAQINFVCKFDF